MYRKPIVETFTYTQKPRTTGPPHICNFHAILTAFPLLGLMLLVEVVEIGILIDTCITKMIRLVIVIQASRPISPISAVCSSQLSSSRIVRLRTDHR